MYIQSIELTALSIYMSPLFFVLSQIHISEKDRMELQMILPQETQNQAVSGDIF